MLLSEKGLLLLELLVKGGKGVVMGSWVSKHIPEIWGR